MQWSGLYYVGADAEQSGIMQGQLAAQAIQEEGSLVDRNRDGVIQYVVLEGEAGHQDAIIRTEKAVDTLKSQGISLEKLSYGVANWNRAQAENRMTQMIGEHQNRIELVLANNDAMALGAMDAYRKLNITEATFPVFFGIDGTRKGCRRLWIPGWRERYTMTRKARRRRWQSWPPLWFWEREWRIFPLRKRSISICPMKRLPGTMWKNTWTDKGRKGRSG